MRSPSDESGLPLSGAVENRLNPAGWPGSVELRGLYVLSLQAWLSLGGGKSCCSASGCTLTTDHSAFFFA